MAANKRRRTKSRRAKRGTYTSAKCSKVIRYRSRWELLYAQYLDAQPSVASYEYEPYAIEYVSNVRTGRIRKYWPDFEITMHDDTKIIVEIKPAKKVIQAKNMKKAYYAKQFAAQSNKSYVILTENELKSLGVL